MFGANRVCKPFDLFNPEPYKDQSNVGIVFNDFNDAEQL